MELIHSSTSAYENMIILESEYFSAVRKFFLSCYLLHEQK